MTKYRILERQDGKFIVQAELSDVQGILWWKVDKRRWVDLNMVGYPCDSIAVPFFLAATYRDMGAARAAVKRFQRGPIIHTLTPKGTT